MAKIKILLTHFDHVQKFLLFSCSVPGFFFLNCLIKLIRGKLWNDGVVFRQYVCVCVCVFFFFTTYLLIEGDWKCAYSQEYEDIEEDEE